jgi:hypothetical protein
MGCIVAVKWSDVKNKSLPGPMRATAEAGKNVTSSHKTLIKHMTTPADISFSSTFLQLFHFSSLTE